MHLQSLKNRLKFEFLALFQLFRLGGDADVDNIDRDNKNKEHTFQRNVENATTSTEVFFHKTKSKFLSPTMPTLRNVPSLADISVDGISELVEKESLRVADYVSKNFMYDEFEAAIRGVSESKVGNATTIVQPILSKSKFRTSFVEHIWRHLSW